MISMAIAIFIFSQFAESRGTERGNGGDAVICEDGAIELLDFYEARKLRRFQKMELVSDKNYKTIAKKALGRLGPIHPVTVLGLQGAVDSFENETSFVEDVDLVDIPDSEHPLVGKKCEVVQLAIQTRPVTADQRRYIVSKDLWDRLDNFNKAGIVVHEILMRTIVDYDFKNKRKDSRRLRYLNSLLFSRTWEAVSRDDKKALVSAVVPYFEEFGAVIFPTNSSSWSGFVFKGVPKEQSLFSGEEYPGRDFFPLMYIDLPVNQKLVSPGAIFENKSNGILTIEFEPGKKPFHDKFMIGFSSRGWTPKSFKLNFNDESIATRKIGYYWTRGQLQGGFLRESQSLRLAADQIVHFFRGGSLFEVLGNQRLTYFRGPFCVSGTLSEKCNLLNGEITGFYHSGNIRSYISSDFVDEKFNVFHVRSGGKPIDLKVRGFRTELFGDEKKRVVLHKNGNLRAGKVIETAIFRDGEGRSVKVIANTVAAFSKTGEIERICSYPYRECLPTEE